MHPYQTLGDIYLQFEDVDGYTDYHRELDLEKASSLLMEDFRGGRLGRMTLERPESFSEVDRQK